jgi:hypothetical protein
MYSRAFEDIDAHVFEAVWMDVEAAAATMGEQHAESARRPRVRAAACLCVQATATIRRCASPVRSVRDRYGWSLWSRLTANKSKVKFSVQSDRSFYGHPRAANGMVRPCSCPARR